MSSVPTVGSTVHARRTRRRAPSSASHSTAARAPVSRASTSVMWRSSGARSSSCVSAAFTSVRAVKRRSRAASPARARSRPRMAAANCRPMSQRHRQGQRGDDAQPEEIGPEARAGGPVRGGARRGRHHEPGRAGEPRRRGEVAHPRLRRPLAHAVARPDQVGRLTRRPQHAADHRPRRARACQQLAVYRDQAQRDAFVRRGDVEEGGQLVEVDLGHHRADGLAPQAGCRHHDRGGTGGPERARARPVHVGLQRLHGGLEGYRGGHGERRALLDRAARGQHAPLGVHHEEAGHERLSRLRLLRELDEVRQLEPLQDAHAHEGLQALDAARQEGVHLMGRGPRHREERLLGLRPSRAQVEPEAPDRARREKAEHADDESDEFRADRPAHDHGRWAARNEYRPP